MKAIQLQSLVKTIDELRVSTLPDLSSSPTQYVIEVQATSTNFFDILQVQGKHQEKPKLPFNAGNEFAGVVLEVPQDLTKANFRVGDRVFGAGLGAFATQIYMDQEALRRIPDHWSSLEASGLFYTAPTAYAALTERAHAKAGEYMLIHGAAGGLGLAAIQIAKALDLRVIAIANSPEKRAICKDYGADLILDSETDWQGAARSFTPNGRGVDIILDPLGMVEKSLKCIAWNGRIVVIGFAAGNIEKIAMNRILLKNCTLTGLFWGMYAKQEPETVKKVWESLLALMEQKKVKPMIYTGATFDGLDNITKALELLSTGKAWGKIAVSVPSENNSKL